MSFQPDIASRRLYSAWNTSRDTARARSSAGMNSANISGLRRLDSDDVDLLHRHHRLHGAPGRSRIAIVNRRHQRAGHDLPAHAELVLAPTTHAFLTTVSNNRIPVAVGFLLRIGEDLERNGFVE